MPRAPLFPLCALILSGTTLAHAERSETPPQQFKPGELVKLHSLAVSINLPTTTPWTLAIAVDGTASWDVLRPLEGATPGLQIELSRSKRPDCNDVAADLDARAVTDPTIVKKATTPLAPATWDPWAYQVGLRTRRLCTNTIEGPILADVVADVANVAPSDVIPLLEEVARVLGGRRSSSPLVGKGPVISRVGTITLPIAGVRVVVPTGWSVKTFDDHGRKVDLLERFEPKDPPLYFTVRRGLGTCVLPRGEGDSVVDKPDYLPIGFQRRVLERTAGDAHISTLCAELGPDAVVVTVSWTRRDDLLDVRTMLAHVAEVDVGIGTSFSSSTANEESEEEDRLRTTISGDVYALTTFGHDRAVGGGASLDLWTVTSKTARPLGLGAELVGGIGYGARGMMPANARIGLGPSLTLGPLVLLPLATLGADALGGDDVGMKAAGTWSLGGRVSLRLANGFALGAFGAEQWRFGGAPTITRERRFGIGLTLRGLGLSAQLTDIDPAHHRARLATLSIGYAF